MKVSFCITCKNRLGHLAQTLPQNLRDNPCAEFVVLGYFSADALHGWMRHLLSEQVRFFEMVRSPYNNKQFFRSHAKNVAHLLATGDILCNLDADNFTGRGFSEYLLENLDENTILKAGETGYEDTTGRIAYHKRLFFKFGGYNEELNLGWGFEDNDLYLRAVHAGIKEINCRKDFLLAIPHQDIERTQFHPVQDKLQSHSVHQQMSLATIANKQFVANLGKPWGEAIVARPNGEVLSVSSNEVVAMPYL